MTDSYDPTANLPAGRVPTAEQDREIMQAFADNGGQPLAEGVVESIVGGPLPAPTISRDWETGQHANAYRNPLSPR